MTNRNLNFTWVVMVGVGSFLTACETFTVIPTVTYGERLDTDGAGFVAINLTFAPKQRDYYMIPTTHSLVALPRPPVPCPDPIPYVPEPTPAAIPAPDPMKEAEEEEGTTISGEWGVINISQEAMKYLIGPLVLGGGLYWRSKRNGAVIAEGKESTARL